MLLALFSIAAGGCASSEGPQVLTVPSSRYEQAFDAALEAAREAGMPALLKDRRGGVIETQTRYAGSFLEPWRTDNASFNQESINTLTFQRRRTRFEFSTTGFQGPETPSPTTLPGPDVIGASQPPTDLTTISGDLELRVWVYVERANTPGIRRDTWSRSKTTTTKLIAPEGESGLTAGTSWATMTRDTAYERRLLAKVQEMLEAEMEAGTADEKQAAATQAGQ